MNEKKSRSCSKTLISLILAVFLTLTQLNSIALAAVSGMEVVPEKNIADGGYEIITLDKDALIVPEGDKGAIKDEPISLPEGNIEKVISAAGKSGPYIDSIMASQDDIYTLTYDANGGYGAPGPGYFEGGASMPVSYSYPTRAGYIFMGWALLPSATTAQYQPNEIIILYSSTILYAVWKAYTPVSLQFSISGSIDPDDGWSQLGTRMKGYSFYATAGSVVIVIMHADYIDTYLNLLDSGWNVVAFNDDYVGSGFIWQNYSMIRYTVETSGTYYVQATTYRLETGSFDLNIFFDAQFTITYDAQGGYPTPPPLTMNYTELAQLDNTLPIKLGNTFMGWCTDPFGDGEYYQRSSVYKSSANVILYAIWAPHEYTVYDISDESDRDGQLTALSPILEARQGSMYDAHRVFLTAGQLVVINMWSFYFDTYLYLLDPDLKLVADDDDSGGGLNSMIMYTVPTTGMYYILASQYYEDYGYYTLSVRTYNTYAALTVDSAIAGAGGKVMIPVTVSDSPLLASLRFRVFSRSNVMKLVDVTLPDDSGFNVEFGSVPGEEVVSLVPKGTDSVNPNGVLLYLTFEIYWDVWPTDYTIDVSDIRAVDENDNDVTFTGINGIISVYRFGDFTHNLKIDGNDILWINRYISSEYNLEDMMIKWPTTISWFNEMGADFTNNGVVDGTDILWIHRYIASDYDAEKMIKRWPTQIDFSHLGVQYDSVVRAANLLNNDSADNSVSMIPDRTTVPAGETFTVTVGLDLTPGTELSTLWVTLDYDTSMLSLKSSGTRFPGKLDSVSAGPFYFTLSPKGTDAQRGGDVISLTFEVLDDSKEATIGLGVIRACTPDEVRVYLPAPNPVAINAIEDNIDVPCECVPVSSIKIDSPAATTVARGVTYDFKAILNEGATGDNIVWSVNNPLYANVNGEGSVSILNRTGSVVLTATDTVSGLSNSIVLRIV